MGTALKEPRRRPSPLKAAIRSRRVDLVRDALVQEEGNIAAAARRLGCHRTYVHLIVKVNGLGGLVSTARRTRRGTS